MVHKKCWRWDAANDWPPFVAHRDLYVERDRCSGERSRDVLWDGGFKQSLLPKSSWDPLYQNNNDCPWRSRVNQHNYSLIRDKMEDGIYCNDGGDETKTFDQNQNAYCEVGTMLNSCGIRKNLVVFGYAYMPFYRSLPDTSGLTNGEKQFYEIAKLRGPTSTTHKPAGIGRHRYTPFTSCVSKTGTTKGKWIVPIPENLGPIHGGGRPSISCYDGGPGSDPLPANDLCYYGTDANCGRRRFAFKFEGAGPDVPDDTCATQSNGICEDGLMWSIHAPGKNTCLPNTDVTDCGPRPAKRFARVGSIAESDTCTAPSHSFDPLASVNAATGASSTSETTTVNKLCYDHSDDLIHTQDLYMRDPNTADLCGRGTQAQTCREVSKVTTDLRYSLGVPWDDFPPPIENQEGGLNHPHDDNARWAALSDKSGTYAEANNKYHEKATYINPNLAGQGDCVSPTNVVHQVVLDKYSLVRPRIYHESQESMVYGQLISSGMNFVDEYIAYAGPFASLEEMLHEGPKQV